MNPKGPSEGPQTKTCNPFAADATALNHVQSTRGGDEGLHGARRVWGYDSDPRTWRTAGLLLGPRPLLP